MTIDRSGFTPDTTLRLHRLEAAESYLAGYRTPEQRITIAEGQRLMQLMDAGWTAADAAEQVQAESWTDNRTPEQVRLDLYARHGKTAP